MYPQRLPVVDGDDGVWGDIIRKYLEKEHYNDDTDNPVNGGHKTITIRPGTTAAGTAPLKFSSGNLLSTPEAGAVEFLTHTMVRSQRVQSAKNSPFMTIPQALQVIFIIVIVVAYFHG
jgi:hypothetical protein